MVIAQPDSPPQTPTESQHEELKNAVRVLGAVVEELSERVELLETRENLRASATPD